RAEAGTREYARRLSAPQPGCMRLVVACNAPVDADPPMPLLKEVKAVSMQKSPSQSSAGNTQASNAQAGKPQSGNPQPGTPPASGKRAPSQGSWRRGRWMMLLIALICAAPVIGSYFTYYVIKPTGGTAGHCQLVQAP